jgi:hypothetical protein
MTTNADAFGSLTALFTSGQGASDDARAHAPREAQVITLLVGNVPVMAGLWTTQYADDVGRHHGPTALVRYERDEVTMELLRAEGRQLPPAGPSAVSRWLPRAAAGMRTWILAMPSDASPAEVLDVGGRVVLMTGADEAAVTGGYLRLKQLADEAIHRGQPLERVGLVMVGAPAEQADAAFRRLGDAVRSFLGIEVESLARLPRLERVESSARATYGTDECPAPGALTVEIARARAEAAARLDDVVDVPAPLPFQSRVEAAPREPATHDHAARHAAAPVAATAPASEPSEPVVPPARHRAPAAFAALPVSDLPERLVPLLPGLEPLGISCPVAPEVELALDADRRMHIVGRSDQLAKVRTARTWATMHRDLLGRAFPALADGFEVRERILLGDAREAIALHGTGALLDVLVTATTPSGTVHVVVPLNDPTTCG